MHFHTRSWDLVLFIFLPEFQDCRMADELDVEAMLEAPYKKEIHSSRVSTFYFIRMGCAKIKMTDLLYFVEEV